MVKMKTLTVSGQTYTVNDPQAVSFAQLQELTPQQKQLARENIGAAAAGAGGGALSAEVVDGVLIVALATGLTAQIADGVLVVT